MIIKINDKVRVITKMYWDGKPEKYECTGTVVKSVGDYPFSLVEEKGGLCPLYSSNYKEWTRVGTSFGGIDPIDELVLER